MRNILPTEITKERCNAAALGAYNASVGENPKPKLFSNKEDFIADIEKENAKRIIEIKDDIEFLKDNRATLFAPEIKILESGLETSKDLLKINQDRVKRLRKQLKK